MELGDGESEYDMLDLLAYNCSQLTAQLSEANLLDDQDKILADYIKRIDNEFETINEFKEGEYNAQQSNKNYMKDSKF